MKGASACSSLLTGIPDGQAYSRAFTGFFSKKPIEVSLFVPLLSLAEAWGTFPFLSLSLDG